MSDDLDLNIDEATGQVELRTLEDNRAAVSRLMEGALRSVYLLTYDLDPLLYDNDEFVSAALRLARSHPQAHVHVIVKDSNKAVSHGHRLVNASQRLASYIKLRKPPEEAGEIIETFLVVDGRGYLYRGQADRWEGTADFDGPLRARELVHQFEALWQRGEPDPNLTRYTL